MFAAAFCGLMLANPAFAAGDVEAGHALTERWCSGCHVIGSTPHGQDAAPALPTIAGGHPRDRDWLRARLTSPHPPMPNFNLTRREIDDVIAYLSSLAPAESK
jgi:mono/diheme cytochrome c family protein